MRDINKITNYEDAGDSFPASFFFSFCVSFSATDCK